MYDVNLYKALAADIESNRNAGHSDAEFLGVLIDRLKKETNNETKKKLVKYILNYIAANFIK